MSVDELRSLIARYSLKGGLSLWQFRVDLRPPMRQLALVPGPEIVGYARIGFSVPDRDTGELKSVAAYHPLPVALVALWQAPDARQFLEEKIREIVLHELGESMQFDGKRVTEPHLQETA